MATVDLHRESLSAVRVSISMIDDRWTILNTHQRRTFSSFSNDQREVLVTSAVDAEPEMREHAPDPTLWPLVAALVTTVVLVASIYTPDAITWGAVPVALVLIGWLYPRKVLAPRPRGREEASAS